MWPFNNNLTPKAPAPGMTQPPVDLSPEARVRALEQRCAQLEWGLRELCAVLATMQDVSNQNFTAIQGQFHDLVAYVLRPSKQIMGDQQDKN
jgi:hypothetical protein